MRSIRVTNSRVNNLKSVTCEFKRSALSVVCGPSGSGKSSLVFGTIYREFLTFLKQPKHILDFLGFGHVERVEGLSFVVGLKLSQTSFVAAKKQHTVASFARLVSLIPSLVEASDQTFRRVPSVHSNDREQEFKCHSKLILSNPKAELLVVLADLLERTIDDARNFAVSWSARGFTRFFIDDRLCEFEELECYLECSNLVCIAVVFDYFSCHIENTARFNEAIELSTNLGVEKMSLAWTSSVRDIVSLDDGNSTSFDLLNNETIIREPSEDLTNISNVLSGSVLKLLEHPFLRRSSNLLVEHSVDLAINIIRSRATLLKTLGLSYLELDRPLSALSSGELQRLRLARAVQFAFSDTTYLLEHPTTGLHPDEVDLVIKFIFSLVESGNTVVCTTHEPELIKYADNVIQLGPGSGQHGGQIVDILPIVDLCPVKKQDEVDGKLNSDSLAWLELAGISCRNLKDLSIKIPLGRLVTIMGVSGSGKSTLLRDCIAPILGFVLSLQRRKKVICSSDLQFAKVPVATIKGFEFLSSVHQLWQAHKSKNLKTTVSRLTGIELLLRSIFAMTQEARIRGFTAQHFSPFTRVGACSMCQGKGYCVELHVGGIGQEVDNNNYSSRLQCHRCLGRRISPEVGLVAYRGLSYFEAQFLTIEEVNDIFQKIPKVRNISSRLIKAGLGYLTLNQPIKELAIGELQRLRFATLSAKSNLPNTVFLLDEPTACMTLTETDIFLSLVRDITLQGASVIVTEHNLRVAVASDYIIELGPGSGEEGGSIVDAGTLSQIAKRKVARLAKYVNAYS